MIKLFLNSKNFRMRHNFYLLLFDFSDEEDDLEDEFSESLLCEELFTPETEPAVLPDEELTVERLVVL